MEKTEGDLNLVTISDEELSTNVDLLNDLVDAIEFEVMPPEDAPQLAATQRDQFLKSLQKQLKHAVALASPPRTPIRRMNRFQYSNAVEDLFKLNVEVFSLPERILREHGNYFDPASGKMPAKLSAGSRPLGKSQLIARRLAGVAPFPQDLRAEHGYDNRGDHLTLSPLLLESFLKLSRSIVNSVDFHRKTCGIWDEFFAEPPASDDQSQAIRKRLHTFLTRAFRRTASDDLVDRYASHVELRLSEGDNFIDAMKQAASAALASPRFLYLYDHATQTDQPERVDDFELASRLSFFFWGSIPDQQLLDLAGSQTLRQPEVLAAQIDRMLNDERMKRFCDSFPGQWLQLERIISSVPDPQVFPEFYFGKYRVSMHMMLEPLLLFETILVENRPILDLIDSDYSYRSDLLKSWYASGKRGPKAPPTSIPFERVNLTDRREGGVITNAAILTMNSGPLRTKPITRGAWMASVIFNAPPEPPPADVPPLPKPSSEEQANLTLRERLMQHRQRPDCASCHERIDPLGFALENYGPTGLWRDQYENGRDVDASGVLFRKHEFKNIIEFKDAVLQEKHRFAHAFAEHLLSFALGREASPADQQAIEEIVKATSQDGYRLRDVMKAVASSEPFLHKYNPPSKAEHVSSN